MDYVLSFKVNDAIYLRDPESSEVGKQMVKSAIDLIAKIGLEHFTFKKLAAETGSTEATIYRYFENKHKMLLYIINWYWNYLAFIVMIQLQNVTDPAKRLQLVIELLSNKLPDNTIQNNYNNDNLHTIVISESSKVYLINEVDEENKSQVFKPFKDLCASVAAIITAYKPDYPYPHSLSSMLMETAHNQHYFVAHLPSLTDCNKKIEKTYVQQFLESLVFGTLSKESM